MKWTLPFISVFSFHKPVLSVLLLFLLQPRKNVIPLWSLSFLINCGFHHFCSRNAILKNI